MWRYPVSLLALMVTLLGEQAAAADCVDSFECWCDLGNGTILDTCTGLQWEKKSAGGGIHGVNNTYTWTSASDGNNSNPDGTAFTVFLVGLNSSCRDNENVVCVLDDDCSATHGGPGGPCGFAGFRDWRLPTTGCDAQFGSSMPGHPELETIMWPAPGCSHGSPCINGIFGPTSDGFYWTGTTAGPPYFTSESA